jgi:DHA3 family tetracycline resistance protein-like MFS transporter
MSRIARPRAAYPVYLGICASDSFLSTVVFTVNMLYQATVVGLDGLHLILVGTALEGTYFIANVPFGVAADTFSRRRSVIAGMATSGAAWVLEGSVPEFWAMIAGAMILGVGAALMDGALEAWAADEMAERDVTSVFLRGGQIGAVGSITGIAATVALSLIDLRLAIVAGGIGSILTAVVLMMVMSEQRPSVGVGLDRTAGRTFAAGVSMVRRGGGLLALIGAVAVAGAFSEGFDRLSTPHLLDVGMPAVGGFQPVVWFGLLAAAGNVTGAAIAEVLRRVATDSEQRRAVALMGIWAGTVVTVILFAAAPTFWAAGTALLLAGPLRALAVPLWMGWMSDHSDPGTRATVLSFAGQADCLGQVACGPLIGVAAVSFSIEAALVLSALMLVPSVILVAAAGRGRTLAPQPAK